MNRPTCCHGDCNQGRTCPHRHAAPPTRREWLFAAGLLALALVLSTLGGCGSDTWLDSDERYACTVDQMQKVEHETLFCRDQVKNAPSACYGGAIMRNCQKRGS